MLRITYIISSILIILAAGIYRFDVDQKFFNIIHTKSKNNKNKLDRAFIIITNLGSVVFITTFNIVLLIILYNTHFKWSYFITITTGIASIINTTLKLIFKRQRPTVSALVKENSYSFPSGHSMVSSCFYILLSTFISTIINTHLVFALGGILILLIAYSRVYLGVHYPVDVITGVGLGLLIAMISLDIYAII